MKKGVTITELLIIIAIVLILAAVVFQFFGSKAATKVWGGSTTIDLPQGRKAVTASWKDNSVWVITREAKDGEKPETLSYKEYSNYGVIQGEVIIREH